MRPTNIFIPTPARVAGIARETPDINTYVFELEGERFDYLPGQFVELSIFGVGEAPFCIASSPTRNGGIECSIKKMGSVTQAAHRLLDGDVVGVRGPYGNHFPLDEMEGKDILFIGGGIGMAPLRPAIQFCIDRKEKYGTILILCGARTPADIVYKGELEEWAGTGDVYVTQTVDPGGETPGWKGRVGLVPKVLEEMRPRTENCCVITCGPPIMIRFTLEALQGLGFHDEKVYTTLEMKMKCGVGKCGRCNIGPLFICKDGPVFSLKQLKEIGAEI